MQEKRGVKLRHSNKRQNPIKLTRPDTLLPITASPTDTLDIIQAYLAFSCSVNG